MAIPPTNDLAGDQIKLGQAIQAIGADVIGIQEVDEKLERSGNVSQTALVAEAMGSEHWGFAPVMVGAPGEKWRVLNDIDLKIITKENVEHRVVRNRKLLIKQNDDQEGEETQDQEMRVQDAELGVLVFIEVVGHGEFAVVNAG